MHQLRSFATQDSEQQRCIGPILCNGLAHPWQMTAADRLHLASCIRTVRLLNTVFLSTKCHVHIVSPMHFPKQHCFTLSQHPPAPVTDQPRSSTCICGDSCTATCCMLVNAYSGDVSNVTLRELYRLIDIIYAFNIVCP